MPIYKSIDLTGIDLEWLKHRIKRRVRLEPNGCWVWTGSMKNESYGLFDELSTRYAVHRLSLYVFKPEEYVPACHCLHKPICTSKLCINPDHLYWGDDSDNQHDSVKINTHNMSNKTSCKQGHPLDGYNLRVDPRRKSRNCKECHKVAQRKYTSKK